LGFVSHLHAPHTGVHGEGSVNGEVPQAQTQTQTQAQAQRSFFKQAKTYPMYSEPKSLFDPARPDKGSGGTGVYDDYGEVIDHAHFRIEIKLIAPPVTHKETIEDSMKEVRVRVCMCACVFAFLLLVVLFLLTPTHSHSHICTPPNIDSRRFCRWSECPPRRR
jgi:hypothetical protein